METESISLVDVDFTIEDGILIKYSGSGGDITIPFGVTSIGEAAFGECPSLTNVTIPSSVTNIGKYSFDGCISLTDVRYGGSEGQWNEMCIEEAKDSLVSVPC